MNDCMWHWRKGDARFYTRCESIAKKAMNDGVVVVGEKIKSRIIKY